MRWTVSEVVHTIMILLIFVLVFLVIGFSIYQAVTNERNRIAEGVILDKQIYEGYTHANHTKENGSFTSVPTTYYFLIQGQKKGETVEYWTNVTATEYDSFKVGEYYRK